MARGKRTQPPAPPVQARVSGLLQDGRGVARVEEKTVFIDGALAGETVAFRYTRRKRSFDEGVVEAVLEPSPHRVSPRCAHFGVCGGCVLQHLEPGEQVRAKQQVLLDDLEHLGQVAPREVLEPLRGPVWGYRRRARLGVKYVAKKGRLLVGFRERGSPLLTGLERCEVLHPSVGERIGALAELIGGLQAYDRIAQVEVAVAAEGTALVFRNLVPLTEGDRDRLIAFARREGFLLFLQPGGPESVTSLWPERIALSYALPEYGLRMAFQPTDFVQINADINQAMIGRALELLEVDASDRVLDLFCGLGNFTLPVAKRAREVVGVEGDCGLVMRARENAARNGIANATFHSADLGGELESAPWWREPFDKVLLDPPRTGARETLPHLARGRPRRLVYVSCNPATLARDAGLLVREYGYRLERAGVMDMFPHTAHVESIALFTR